MKPQDSEAGPLTIDNIALDLQIIICTLLHPSDILALRETCKTLQLPTRQRVVWLAALHRICVDNSFFLPSFPTLDMSDVELEHAAMAPHRWIELCAAFEKKCLNDPGAALHPRVTRIIDDSFVAEFYCPELFIVPGGRYLVRYSPSGIFVWDLGYTSTADCKLIASVGPEGGSYDCLFQATPDGMGLIILSSRSFEYCSVYEIYPQSETPQLTRIARLGLHPHRQYDLFLLPDRVLLYYSSDGGIIFRVWDYRMNHSISFLADIDLNKVEYYFEVIATKTAIIVVCLKEILVWAIPPLSPQPLDFFDDNLTRIPPLVWIAYPDGIARCHAKLFKLQTMSHWYGGSSQPLYFDISCQDSEFHRFEIIVKPNLLDTSLHLINIEPVPHDFFNVAFQTYSIWKNILFVCWETDDHGRYGAFTGLTSSCSTGIISLGGPATKMLFPSIVSGFKFILCPTSGRYVYQHHDTCGIVVVDLF